MKRPYPEFLNCEEGSLVEDGPDERVHLAHVAAKPTKKKRKDKRKQVGNDSGIRQFIAKSKIDVKSDKFLESFEWRSLRMMALKKYSPKCMCCGATPATGAVMNVDHIKPRKLFPALALDINNLQILCHECNHGKGNWDRTDWR